MGEEAFATYMTSRLSAYGVRLEVDESDRPGGDDGIDFRIAGVPIQIKTRQKIGDLLIRRTDESGKLLCLPWDIAVVATWADRGDDDASLIVKLDGWASRRMLTQKGSFLPARRGDHFNLELPDKNLLSMANLVRYFKNHLTKR